MTKLKWFGIFGKHKEFATEELFVGDVIAKTLTEAKRRAKRRFTAWKITRVIVENKTPTSFEILKFYND